MSVSLVLAALPGFGLGHVDFDSDRCGWKDPSEEQLTKYLRASWRELSVPASGCDLMRVSVDEWRSGSWGQNGNTSAESLTEPIVIVGDERNTYRLSNLLSRRQLQEVWGGVRVAPAGSLSEEYSANSAYFQQAEVPLRMFIEFVLARGMEQVVDSAWWSRDELQPLRMEVMSAVTNVIDTSPEKELTQQLLHNSTSSYAYIGSPGTGAAFHRHGIAYNALACGRKRWWFAPPERFELVVGQRPIRDSSDCHGSQCSSGINLFDQDDAHTGGKTKSWLKQCIQHEGEIIVVPEGWLHATLNVAETVGVALVPGGHA